MTKVAEIIGPSGTVHYRRPADDPMVEEARRTEGYSVRILECTCAQPHHLPVWHCTVHGDVNVPVD